MSLGVGTPSRVIDLLNAGELLATLSQSHKRSFEKATLTLAGALSTSELRAVVVDCSHIDQKKRSILDMREIQQPLIKLLNRPELKGRYGRGGEEIKLLVY